jgi:hypothetical protein
MCGRSAGVQGGSNMYLLDPLLTDIEAYYTIQLISNQCILNSKKKKKKKNRIKNNITNGVVDVIGVTVALLQISVNGNGLC